MTSKPTCAVCGHEVDEFMTFRDEMRHVNVYVVRCHGDEQTVEMDDIVIEDATSLSLGRAFATPRLSP